MPDFLPDQALDSRDLYAVTSEGHAEAYYDLIARKSLLENVDNSMNILPINELPFLEWVKRGSQLSLASGIGVGETHFAQELGISPQNVSLVDRIHLDSKIVESFRTRGMHFLPASVESWAKNVIKKVTETETLPKFRIITLFGAEYILSSTPAEVRDQVAQAIFLSLEPGGVVFITPPNIFLQASLAKLSNLGLRRVSANVVGLYQKSSA